MPQTQLTSPALAFAKIYWQYATTTEGPRWAKLLPGFTGMCKRLNRTGFAVYRSVIMSEDYDEVRDFLRDQDCVLVWKGLFVDVDLVMGNEGELSIYVTRARGGSAAPDDDAVLAELEAECANIIEVLAKAN